MYKIEEDISLPTCKLIEDLGRLYATETSKEKTRFGIYECGFCGKHFKTATKRIKNGTTKSCGCYALACSIKNNTKHGGKGTKLYGKWKEIRKRTSNPNYKQYSDYGGRGIKMCEEWSKDFVSFRDWALANGYEDDKRLSIDRIDNDGNYEPSNCRWTTSSIQNRNKRIPKNGTCIYRGVYFDKKYEKYVAQIGYYGKNIYLGRFKTDIEGAIAYNNYIIDNNLEGFILNVMPEEFKDAIPQRLSKFKGETN